MKSTNLVNFKIFVLDEFVLSGLISRVGQGVEGGMGYYGQTAQIELCLNCNLW